MQEMPDIGHWLIYKDGFDDTETWECLIAWALVVLAVLHRRMQDGEDISEQAVLLIVDIIHKLMIL